MPQNQCLSCYADIGPGYCKSCYKKMQEKAIRVCSMAVGLREQYVGMYEARDLLDLCRSIDELRETLKEQASDD